VCLISGDVPRGPGGQWGGPRGWTRGGPSACCDCVEGDVGDHVLLALHEAAPADLDEERTYVDAVPLRCGLGVPKEGSVDPGVAEGEGLTVDPNWPVPQRSDQVLGGILECEQVAAVRPAVEVGDCDERFRSGSCRLRRPDLLARHRRG
jgi:hypothetical protein